MHRILIRRPGLRRVFITGSRLGDTSAPSWLACVCSVTAIARANILGSFFDTRWRMSEHVLNQTSVWLATMGCNDLEWGIEVYIGAAGTV